MSSLSHPSGPEPERVYWVRRGIVAVAVLATVALAGWVLSMLFGSGGTTASAGPAQNDPSLISDTPSSPSAPATTPSPSPSASGSPTASQTASISLTTPSGSTRASASASRSASKPASASAATPSAPLVCAASDVALKVAGASSVKSGSHTSIDVSFTNRGSTTCTLDFSRTPLTLKIYSGTDRIWTSADCTSWVPSGVHKLAAGKAYTFTEEWPTLRSAAGCKLRNTYLQPGTYVATATVPGGSPAQLVMSLHA